MDNGTDAPQRLPEIMMDNGTDALQRLPEIVMDKIFSYLELPDFLNCMLVCKNWHGILGYENTEPWRTACRRLIPRQAIVSGPYSTLDTPKEMVRTYCHGWNPDVCSVNAHIRSDGLTIFHNPMPHRYYDAVHAKIGYASGVHVWDMYWKRGLGRMEMVGVTTDVGKHWLPKAICFPCKDQRMWGWEMRHNRLFRDFDIFIRTYPKVNDQFDPSDFKIRLILNLERREMWFERNGNCLGLAYKNLPSNTKLYPFSLCFASPATVSIVYVGQHSKRF